ncbi:MAG TPA: hypothetical protein VML36_09475 [Nitrospiria bacterium]|nr:hypothetical protein [Nitrospiria bacterium]
MTRGRKDWLARHLSLPVSTPLIGFTLAVLACTHSTSMAGADLPQSLQDKLDPSLIRRLNDLRAGGSSDQPVSVLVRTTAVIGPDQERQLEHFGMTIHSKSGIILSATLPASSIPAVAALDYIDRLELARRLSPRETP